jgi:hypothetical protein
MATDGRSIARTVRRLLLLAVAFFAFDCQTSREEPTGGETHFLQRCRDGSADCGPGLDCACGVCTIPCADAAACGSFPQASCLAPPEDAACGASSGSYCDVGCAADEDCAVLSPDHRCDAGLCRSGGAAEACTDSDAIGANELVILGDSFFAADHGTTAFLEDLARARGAISAGERYRDYSSVLGNTLSLLGRGIADQYTTALAESPVRVVLMTGGGADALLGSCEVVSDTCPILTAAAAEASALLQRMADDGVEQVVYVFYPDPTDPELRAEIVALRPLLELSCRASPVPCAWIDLRPVFSGNEDTYLNPEGTVPTTEGARATAAELWSVMSARCIAQ